MDQLPVEILRLILRWDVSMCRLDKNSLLPLRLTCKAFDNVLRPYLMKTIKMEYSCFLRDTKYNVRTLERVGNLCDSIYLDMMVIRDEEEISRLTDIFDNYISKVPGLKPMLANLRKYCMSDTNFDVFDFKRVTKDVLKTLPNVRRFKILLPYQIVSTQGSPATTVLTTTFACLAHRNEEHQTLDTLVIDYVSDTTINSIFHNHIDLQNAIRVFRGLRNLTISIKRQETRSQSFPRNLWFLIRKAKLVESLCVFGWNTKRDNTYRKLERSGLADVNNWTVRCLPYPLEHSSKIRNIQFLELKRVDMAPEELLKLIEDCSLTLKELYLIEVYLKNNGEAQMGDIPLWVGYPQEVQSNTSIWVAHSLQEMESLNLSVLRATGLGYDDFAPDRNSQHPDYDIPDTSGRNKNLDQRFVEAVMHSNIKATLSPLVTEEESEASLVGFSDVHMGNVDAFLETSLPPLSNIPPLPSLPDVPADVPPVPSTSSLSSSSLPTNHKPANQTLKPADYDAEIYQLYHNTTSHYKKCIDGHFIDHHEHACRELQNMITVADRGIDLISQEIRSYRHVQVAEGSEFDDLPQFPIVDGVVIVPERDE